jgi:3-methyl-2-oxobutanoate hydroxymethyltransferase
VSVTVKDLQAYKREGKRFAMLTAYDFTTARIVDEAGIPVILVGDSLANTMLGYDTTLPVTMEEMLHHTRAVRRGVLNALLVGDMPFMSYHASAEDAIVNAGRFLKEAGANAIKLEGGGRVVDITRRLTEMGIPVMAHLGLTPQFVNQFGGFKVQGKSDEAAERIQKDAQALQEAGAFALVLEGIPAPLGKLVTHRLDIPTIGIGAGPDTDAQVLVIQDMLGLSGERVPKFVKRYADFRGAMTGAVQAFMSEVESGAFPTDEHSYGVARPQDPAAVSATPGEAVGDGAIYGGARA